MKPVFAFIHSCTPLTPITTHSGGQSTVDLPPKLQRTQDAGRSGNGDVGRLVLDKQILDDTVIDHSDKALAASIAEQAAGIKVEPESLCVLA